MSFATDCTSSCEASCSLRWPDRAALKARPVAFHIAPMGAGPSEYGPHVRAYPSCSAKP
jgi:hypothetical protein